MNLTGLGSSIRTRREYLNLTKAKLEKLSGLSRQTLVGLEAGSLKELGFNRVGQILEILGLGVAPPQKAARERNRGLLMAVKTAGVSYPSELQPGMLGYALATEKVPTSFVGHVTHLLDKAPLPIIVMAVEGTATLEHVPLKTVWRNVGRLAKSLAVHRRRLLT